MPLRDEDVQRYRSALLLLARVQVRRQRVDIHDPSDLVQKTLMEACKPDAIRGTGDDEVFAWLRRALRNNLLDAWDQARAGRRDAGRKLLEADLTESFAGLDDLLLAPDSSPSQKAVRNEDLVRLHEALEKLPEGQREAVMLKHLAGWTLQQIGEKLNCSVAGAAGLLYRGRQALRDLLHP